MTEDQFTRLFVYVEKRFNLMDARFEEMASKEQVNHLIDTVDALAAKLEGNEVEQAARDSQFSRLADWSQKVGAKNRDSCA